MTTDSDLTACGVEPPLQTDETALRRAQRRMEATGQWRPGQAMGRRWPIGCVALEITQRCNLDCSLCYLSEHAESVRDLPLAEVFRRIDMIRDGYGAGTNVQVTGGDPTLRRRDELVAIVRRLHERGLRSTLMTNGIRARRPLLGELADAGLTDVAFHVDMTQGRRGFADEAALNAVRRAYIDRARGLGLAVFFNTTVFAGNIAEIPAVVRFFVDNSNVVSLASFQLQADAGRGVLRGRPAAVTVDRIVGLIEAGAGTALTFDALSAGHAQCNRYAAALVCHGRAHDLLDDRHLAQAFADATTDLALDRTSYGRTVARIAGWLARHPGYWPPALRWLGRTAWRMRRDLWKSRLRVRKLSFFIHNFMDACALDPERLGACVFMAATADGPVSMCLHNARRDDTILRPIRLPPSAGGGLWDPRAPTRQDGGRPIRGPMRYRAGSPPSARTTDGNP